MRLNVIAEFETKDKIPVAICVSLTNDSYFVIEGNQTKQENMTANDCIRYLAHRLQSK